ncbi:glycosyltransferase family 2 protein [Rhodoplanes sp. TEM]|uniref:Glycosyltransferase family 2 protein n=1 Tax=Rhodoplanes tepidamans TaxID=200616 RepID=A0ABT5JGI8_RHOTP|nr:MULTISPECIES: glycosyltransferase family 2 protein [Rhodoplanes]MDC7788830.1 glycosyltransferase family 2 protein [Rhodoplanes tepidamans]MDC7987103.1 glycosyltransferase family 2 protein [Rhodoplanes sp. TEM]MDQ0357498.1 GT2 family glycosyltransferase [Rhodoplanes tepidamans]
MLRHRIDLLGPDVGVTREAPAGGNRRMRWRFDLDAAAMWIAGWHRVKIIGRDACIERVRVETFDAAGDLLGAHNTVVGPHDFRAYVHVGPAVRRLVLEVELHDDATEIVSATLRPIHPLEILWKALWAGDLLDIRGLGGVLRPAEPLVVSLTFPVAGRRGDPYPWWIEHREPEVVEAARRGLAATTAERPGIAVLLTVCDPAPDLLARTLESVQRQTAPGWTLCIADDASRDPAVRAMLDAAATQPGVRLTRHDERRGTAAATDAAFALADAPFVTCLDHDDLLAPTAIEIAAGTLARFPATRLLYSDQDKVDAAGRRFDPFFKPGFSPELLRGCNYLNHMTVLASDPVRAVGGWRDGFDGAQDHDLVLRVVERIAPAAIHHVPLVLYHWRAVPGSVAFDPQAKPDAADSGRRAVAEHLARLGLAAEVSLVPGAGYRVRHLLPDPPPRVSVVVPFRDRADLLHGCMESLLERTCYPDLEVVLVDNGSTSPEALRLVDHYRGRPAVRVVAAPGPFNYSALNNRGVTAASGTVLCFLNNDTSAITPDWLADMVGYALQDGVGCVGAKLLYPNDTVQHGGVVLGLSGVADHVFVNAPADAHGYFGRLRLASNYSAVTGACMVMRRAVFEEVGGFDETELPVSFNDVDLCLRVGARGYRNVVTPFATLYHFESASRGSDRRPDRLARAAREVAALKRRHGPLLDADPCYSPHLSRTTADFSIEFDETVRRRSWWRSVTASAGAATATAPDARAPSPRSSR